MSASSAWQAMRHIIAEKDGYRCTYCGVPTGATVEHVQARANEGSNRLDNLRLACPSCNSRKGSEPLESWMARRGWELPPPPALPDTVMAMTHHVFSVRPDEDGVIRTGSPNARLEIEGDDAIVAVRVARGREWQRFRLGRQNHPAVVAGAYDFLRRHHTGPTKNTRR